ncbi:heavy metal translocating P-type ATPase [Adlercreutzia sp. ZJ242]|uniref:heavy metal translocating P-type ATPase n=1 Tax=Adlercreutzia sp. ZJ242 TaxID=2709409 RepID=UPI001F152AB0|nr:heavy metal translocating P-type ATPase [Adlercreutzia sp. ZJ242]
MKKLQKNRKNRKNSERIVRCVIKHSLPGRLRLQLPRNLTDHEAMALEETFLEMTFVRKATAYPHAASFAVEFEPTKSSRNAVVGRIAKTTFAELNAWRPNDAFALAPRSRELYAKLANLTAWFILRLFMPKPLKTIVWFRRALPFWKASLGSLRHRRLDVPVLDGAAIAMGFTQGASNAGETMLLLHVGEILEDYTRKRSESSLAQSLLGIPTTARANRNDVEVEVDLSDLQIGEHVIVRTGDAMPVDGTIVSGEAMVNQSSLTGEPLPVMRQMGDSVYAGTAVEEGEICVRVTSDPAQSKINSILAMMQDTNAAKSSEQKRIENIADKLVPWNFALAGAVALATRSLSKTAACLMVDYSCALKMSGAIAVMAAQREGARRGFLVKGSRYFDAIAKADTLVFDKTGTLTAATPAVHHVEPYNGFSRKEVLRLAACLEEHFPHPVARAVVNAALEEHLEHRKLHSDVEYVVAHGIVSSLENGKRVVIGSQHFVLEDEAVQIDAQQLEHIHGLALGTSPLFLAVDHQLRGVIYIDDPLKEEARSVVENLHAEGFRRVIMLTGDADRTARRIAEEAGIDEYHADLLPEDKHRFVRKLQAEGCKVCMVGDGVNDSPALATADVSIAMSAGSAVAREAADIALTSDDLHSIVYLRTLSRTLQRRMNRGYRFAIGFNSLLLALSIAGVLTPQQSALFHNASTIVLSAASACPYLSAPNGTTERFHTNAPR